MAELSARYAAALLELCLESGRSELERWIAQAIFVRDAMQTPDCQQVIAHPHIPDADKRQFLGGLFDGRVNESFVSFLYLAISKNREEFIVPALTIFIDKARHETGKTEALVVSASPLTERQLLALTSLLSRKLHKQVLISSKVDPSLIGGFYVHVDGYVIDNTVTQKIKNIKNNLKRGDAG